MAIYFEEQKKIFELHTTNSTYLIGVAPEDYVGHIYYGERLSGRTDNYLLRMEEIPFTPSVNKREKLGFLPECAQ